MKPTQNHLVMTGLVIGILILAGVLVWIVSNKKQVGVSLSKEFATELHNGLQKESEINQALVDDIDDSPVPTENRDQFFLLQNVARAYQRELDWLKERETVLFEELQKTENNLTAQNALKKEIAYFVLFQYLKPVNQQTTDDVSQPGFDREETIRNAEQELQVLQANSLVPGTKLKELAQESGLTETQIQAGIQESVAAFLEFKKNEFQGSVTSYEKAVVGKQLLAWKFMLQGAEAPAG